MKRQLNLILIALFTFAFISGCTLQRPSFDSQKIQPIVYKEPAFAKYKSVCMISGGAANGIYSVGWLSAYFEKNPIERFDVVTGVSAGSLVASFAFIGHMEVARLAFLSLNSDDMMNNIRIANVLRFNSLENPDYMKQLIDTYVDNNIIDQVAREGGGGRRLYVGATNMDTGDFQVFDMTDVAQKKQYDRYRSILAASSSIPLVFAPQFIDNAMYYDGGLKHTIFLPGELDKHIGEKTDVYVLMNSLHPGNIGVMETENNLSSISQRMIAILSENVKLNDYANILDMPGQLHYYEVPINSKTVFLSFTKQELQTLYDYGYTDGSK